MAAAADASSAEGGGGQPSATAAATETTEAFDTTAETVDPWAGAQAFNTVTEVSAYASSPDSPVALPSIASAETAADSTESTEATETTQASTSATSTTVAPIPPPFNSAPGGSLYPCDTGDLPTAPILWMDERALLVRDDAIGEFEIVSAATCAVLVSFPIG